MSEYDAAVEPTPALSTATSLQSSFPRSPPGVSNDLQSELEKKAACRARRKEQKMSRVLRIGLHFPSTPAEEEFSVSGFSVDAQPVLAAGVWV